MFTFCTGFVSDECNVGDLLFDRLQFLESYESDWNANVIFASSFFLQI